MLTKVSHQPTIAYRILIYFLYVELESSDFFTEAGQNRFRINTSDMARYFKTTNTKLLDSLEWLHDNSLLSEFTRDRRRGIYYIGLTVPKNIK